MQRILLVDDDVELCEMVAEYLTGEGFTVDAVHNGINGVDAALSGRYDLTILDVMMPRLNGLDALRRIRAGSSIPVLMLTARGSETIDRILGLEIGADDYLGKPFHPRELTARIRSVLRRAQGTASSPEPPAAVPELRDEQFIVGDVLLDVGARVVLCGGEPVTLTAVEFDLLATLLRSAGRVVARDTLAQTALGRRLSPYDRSLDMHLSNLRKKLGDSGDAIKTVRSVGYIFALPLTGKVEGRF